MHRHDKSPINTAYQYISELAIARIPPEVQDVSVDSYTSTYDLAPTVHNIEISSGLYFGSVVTAQAYKP